MNASKSVSTLQFSYVNIFAGSLSPEGLLCNLNLNLTGGSLTNAESPEQDWLARDPSALTETPRNLRAHALLGQTLRGPCR